MLAKTKGPSRPIQGWAMGATLGLAIVGVSIIVMGTADLNHLGVVHESESQAVSTDEYDESLDELSSSGRFFTGTYLVTGVFFIGFFHTAYSNIVRAVPRGVRFGTYQAIWPWFVPIFNLVRPKQVADDIWRGSWSVNRGHPDTWRQASVSPLVHWWWAMHLSFLLGLQLTARTFGAFPPGSEGERLVVLADLMVLGAGLIALVLTLAYIHQIVRLQETLRAKFGAQ